MKKLLALVMVAVMATPAFAAVQNVKVSGSILSSYLNREDLDLGLRTGPDYKQGLFITQTRLHVDSDLSDNVSTKIGLINERVWGAETAAGIAAQNTDVQLYLANVTLRELLYSPLTVVVGRQTFAYGNGLIIDATGTNNAATGNLGLAAADLTQRSSLDAVRAILDYKPLTIETFYAKQAANNNFGAGNIKDDVDVYGINTNYQLGDSMNTVFEAYFFGKEDATSNGTNPTVGANSKNDTVYAPGLRASTNPIKGLNVQGEVAWQRGTKVVAVPAGTPVGNQRREAMAFQGIASYELPVLEQYKPVAGASYSYLSGDSNPQDGTFANEKSTNKYTAWDPMLENQNGGTVYNTIFNLTNMHIASVSLSATPLEDVTTKLTLTKLWADKTLNRQVAGGNAGTGTLPTTYFTQPDGSTFAPVVNSKKDLGQEIDADISYAYTEDVKFGLSLGWYIPGQAFEAQNDDAAKQVIASVGVNF